MRRRVLPIVGGMVVAAMLLSAAVLSTASALADGDPASDVLLGANAFYPYSPSVSRGLQQALTEETSAAQRAGFPIKVALIASPVDLGAVAPLFGQPQQYAAFLGQELSFASNAAVVVVMPAGYGADGFEPSAMKVLSSLKKPVAGSSDALASAAIVAVRELAAASGHPLRIVSEMPTKRQGGIPAAVTIAIVLLVCAAIAAAVVAMRRRRARPTDERTGTAEGEPLGAGAYGGEGKQSWAGERWAQETRGADTGPTGFNVSDGAPSQRVEQNVAIPEQLAPEAAPAQVQAEVRSPHRASVAAQPVSAEEPQAIASRRSSRAKLAAAGIIALLMGAGVAAAIVIISKHHRHVAPQPRSAVAAAGAQTAAGVAPAHPTATTSQATRAGATGNPLAGSTRQGTPRGATGQRNSPPATGAPTVAHGQPLQTPRSQRLVQQLEIAIIDDAAQKAKQRSAAASTTCTPAVGSTAKNASTTTYNCTAFVHANSSDSGNRYRYTGTVDLRSGKASWHFVGAE